MKRMLMAVAVGLILGAAMPTLAKPLKVFILVGQSNMQGNVDASTLASMADDPKTAPILTELQDAQGKPRVCEQVWISSIGCAGNDTNELTGKVTAGFGVNNHSIGPEFSFGIFTEKALHEPILIIKTAWGGKSLHTDFRSPSAGPYVWSDSEVSHYKNKSNELEKAKADRIQATGVYYRLMIEHVRKVLKDVKRVCPAYDEHAGYELAGFVWFQGFNDLVSGETYDKRNQPGGYDLYSELLCDFIRDVRKDLQAPKMPFVIGVMGVDGLKGGEKPGGMQYFRQAMAAPASLPEFKGNVVAVETAPFWDDDIVAAQPKQNAYNQIVSTAHAFKKNGTLNKDSPWEAYWKPIGKPLPAERNWRFKTVAATEKKDLLSAYADRRFRVITLPSGMEKWYLPEFDDSQWQPGQAPIGKGVWKGGGVALTNYPSSWGEGEFLLMRSTFVVEDLNFAAYRLAILAKQGYEIYLNGHKIHTYVWWSGDPCYQALKLNPEQTKYLKLGTNVLAVYANDQYSKGAGVSDHYGALDVLLEGLTTADQEKLERALEEVFPLKDRKILKGASNAAYHYLGAAKIMAPIGKAFAEAAVALQPSQK